MKKPVYKAASADQENKGVKRKTEAQAPKQPVVAKRKLSDAEIKKLQAKKAKTAVRGGQSIGARKLVASQFRSLVDMPRTAAAGTGGVTLESMAAGEEDAAEEEEAEAIEEEKADGEDPEAGDNPEEADVGRSWLFKPDSAVGNRDEDSD